MLNFRYADINDLDFLSTHIFVNCPIIPEGFSFDGIKEYKYNVPEAANNSLSNPNNVKQEQLIIPVLYK